MSLLPTITVSLALGGGEEAICSGYVLQENIYKAIEPLRATDTSIGLLNGEMPEGSLEYELRYRLRKDAARLISEAITEQIMKTLKTKDTFNGFPVISHDTGLSRVECEGVGDSDGFYSLVKTGDL